MDATRGDAPTVEQNARLALALFDARTRRLRFSTPLFLDILPRNADLNQDHGRRIEPAVGAGNGHGSQPRWDDLHFGEQQQTMISAFGHAVKERTPVCIRELRFAGGQELGVWDYSLIPILSFHARGDGDVRYVCVSCADATGRARAKEGAAELDQLKNEFLSIAGHELRTPLMPLTAYADVLSRLVDAPAEKELVRKLQQQLRQLARLTDDLMDVAWLETGALHLERVRVNFVEIVRHAVSQAASIADKPAVHLAVAEQAENIEVDGDRSRIAQAVFNLISNAVTRAAESDAVDVAVSRDVRPPHPPAAVVELTAHGRFVAEDERAYLQDRLTQPREGRGSRRGFRLGLYICRTIVEQHGGTIEVEPAKPQGAVFRLRLPIANAEHGGPPE